MEAWRCPLEQCGDCSWRDVWSATDLRFLSAAHTVSVPSHEAALLIVTGTEAPGVPTR
jgi:hypothetical protein